MAWSIGTITASDCSVSTSFSIAKSSRSSRERMAFSFPRAGRGSRFMQWWGCKGNGNFTVSVQEGRQNIFGPPINGERMWRFKTLRGFRAFTLLR
jgi:hypothetical protein